jgi:AAA domain
MNTFDCAVERSTQHQHEQAHVETSTGDFAAVGVKSIREALAFRRAEAEALRKRFWTVKELYGKDYKPVEWLVPGILPNESLVSIQGRPKCGKSTFVFAMMRALLEGGTFLEAQVRPSRVVYLSEQNRISFCQQLQESGINPDTENMSVMTAEDFYIGRWEQNFEAAEQQLLKTRSRLLVVDSWGKFSSFSEYEDEYQSGPTQLRVNKLRHIIGATGATVLIIHHTSKQQKRNLIDAGLGATALAAQVDQAFSLSGEPQKQAAGSKEMLTERHRCLKSVGRFTDAITDVQIERLGDGRYRRPLPDLAARASSVSPRPEVILREAYVANPQLANFGNQKLSRELDKMDIALSERQIAKCRTEHPELSRVK